MAYLFTTFNAFQGVFIFVFHCALQKKVRVAELSLGTFWICQEREARMKGLRCPLGPSVCPLVTCLLWNHLSLMGAGRLSQK